MKKFLKSLTLLALVFTMIMSMAGCSLFGGFDAQTFITGEIESNYLNIHSDEYLATLADAYTIEELEAYYNDNMSMIGEYFLIYLGADTTSVAPETLERATTLFKNIYSNTKFEVSEAVNTDTGYSVDVTIYPIDVIVNTITDAYFTDLSDRMLADSAVIDMTDEQLNEYLINDLLTTLETALTTVGHLEPQTFTMVITEKAEYYEADENTWIEIDAAILPLE